MRIHISHASPTTDGGQTLDPASELILPQPHNNQNGGQLAFGPDG